MINTFGDHLQQFAHSVDIIPENVFNEVFQMTLDYVKEALKIDYLDIYSVERVSNEVRLMSDGNGGRERWENKIRDEHQNLTGHIAYVFTAGKPLWATGAKDECLSETNDYIDHWGEIPEESIPTYVPQGTDLSIRTSISFPLIAKREIVAGQPRISFNPRGVITFDSSEFLEATPDLKEEFQDIANAISLIYQFAEHFSLISASTDEACKRLRQHLNDSLESIKTNPIIGNPFLFFATPENSEKDVIGKVKHILTTQFDNKISYYHWPEDKSAGNIHLQLWERVRQARYGIFYLSEKDYEEPEEPFYKDNNNVLYEAGMMQALQEKWDTTNIILIRESKSPEIQFDLISDRRMTVPRTDNNKLNEETFEQNLVSRLGIINDDAET